MGAENKCFEKLFLLEGIMSLKRTFGKIPIGTLPMVYHIIEKNEQKSVFFAVFFLEKKTLIWGRCLGRVDIPREGDIN